MKIYNIQISEEFGRGLYASKNIMPGEVIADCELLVFTPSDTKRINETDLQFYTFKYNETQDCLVLGDGELFNHNDRPNVYYWLIEHHGRKIMRFIANRVIVKGEQLFINYADDTDEIDPSTYNVNMVG